MQDAQYDVLVVGSGASGSFAARELTAQGLKVLMLEAGRSLSPSDFDPARKVGPKRDPNVMERAEATLKGQGVQARAVFFRKWMSHLFVNDRKNPYTTPPDAPYLWIRGKQGGGRLHSFGRVLLRWSDDDFKIRSRKNAGVDWPISYADVAPFYDEVEQCLGLIGNTDGLATMPDGIYAQQARLSKAEAAFKSTIGAKYPRHHVVSWRYIAPDPERVYRPMRDALATGLLEVRHNAIVRRILTNGEGNRATGVEYLDGPTGTVRRVDAAAVVVCASPIESIRLLLNSASTRHPRGLGNTSDMLGRYFMDQLPNVAQGSFPPSPGWSKDETAPQDPFYAASGGVFISPADADGSTAAGDFTFQGAIGRSPVADGAASRWAFFGFGRMMPHAHNRVTLDKRRKDAWGIPVPHIRCAMHPSDELTMREQNAALLDMIKGAGGEFEFLGSPLGLVEMGPGAYPKADPLSRALFRLFFRKTMVMGSAIHESGGARMGERPEDSVLNRWNQSWDVPNLLVTDASAFAGSGLSGTTLTVMALTVRACRRLAGEMRSGRLDAAHA